MLRSDTVSERIRDQALAPLECDVPDRWSLAEYRSAVELKESLSSRGGAGCYEHRADRPQQLSLAEAAREAGAEERARDRRERAEREQVPVDARRRVPDNAGHAHADADCQVGPHRRRGRLADEAEQRRHAQRPEDQAHDPAEDADGGAAQDSGADVEQGRLPPRASPPSSLSRAPGLARCRRSMSTPKYTSRAPMPASRTSSGDLARDIAAGHRADHRRRRHPREQSPVDSAGADVHDGRGDCRNPRDTDVRPGPGGRRGSEEEHGGQAQVAEHQPDEATGQGDDEAPATESDELDGFHRRGSLHGEQPARPPPWRPDPRPRRRCLNGIGSNESHHPASQAQSSPSSPPNPARHALRAGTALVVLLLAATLASCGDDGARAGGADAELRRWPPPPRWPTSSGRSGATAWTCPRCSTRAPTPTLRARPATWSRSPRRIWSSAPGERSTNGSTT